MDNRDGQVDAMEMMLEAFKKLNVSSNTSTVFPQLTVFTNACIYETFHRHGFKVKESLN